MEAIRRWYTPSADQRGLVLSNQRCAATSQGPDHVMYSNILEFWIS